MQPQQPWSSQNPYPAQAPILPPVQPLPAPAPVPPARAKYHRLLVTALWLFFAICIGLAVIFLAVPATRDNKQDNKRKSDVAYIANQAEVAYSEQHYYPTLAELNSPALSVFSAGKINNADFKDPTGSSAVLTSTPGKGVFAYEASPAGCNNTTVTCMHFKVIATLSTGKTYSVSSKH